MYSGALLGNGAASVRSFITTPSWTPSPILIYEIKMYRRNCRWPQLSHLCVKMYLWIDREMENCRVPFIFTQPSQCPIPVFWVFALSGMLPHPLPTPSHHTHAPSNSTLKIPLIFFMISWFYKILQKIYLTLRSLKNYLPPMLIIKNNFYINHLSILSVPH